MMGSCFRNCIGVLALCLATVNTANAEWVTLGQANEKRYEMIAVEHDNKLVVINGFNRSVDLVNSVEIYDPKYNSWTLVNTTEVGLENAVTHAAYVLIEDELWIMGGRIGDHPGKVSNKVWIYNIKENDWREGPELPVPFAGGGAGYVNGSIYLFGGLDTDARCDVNHHFVYDLKKARGWEDITDTAAMPMARNHFSTVVYDDEIFALGGQNNHDKCKNGSTVEVSLAHAFDPKSRTWTRLEDLPFNRSHSEPATFVYNDKIFIVGGLTNGKKVISYDPNIDQWAVESDLELPETLMAPAARIINNRFYVAMGGETLHTNSSSAMRVHELPEHILKTDTVPTADASVPSNIATPITPKIWTDSYSVDGQCYCDTNFDHGVGDLLYSTPVGEKKVHQICADIKSKFGVGEQTGRIYYNTVQCGHDPVNLDRIYDEWICPGIPVGHGQYTGDRCLETGAKWNLDRLYIPVTDTEATEPASQITEPASQVTDVTESSSLITEVITPSEVKPEVEGPTDTTDVSQDGNYEVIYRINTGGPALSDASGNWAAGKDFNKYVDSGVTWSRKANVDLSDVTVAVPSALFDTERSNRRKDELHWKLPVSPGQYTVRLYFAETYHGNRYVGARVFDVFVEDESLIDLDIYKEVKGDTGLVKAFEVSTDNILDIKLSRKIENPSIKGIEVLRREENTASEQSVVVNATPATPVPVVTVEPEVPAIQPEPEVISETVTEQSVAVEPEAPQPEPVIKSDPVVPSQSEDQSSSNAITTSVVYRINTGGPTLNVGGTVWQSGADSSDLVNTGRAWSNKVGVDTTGVASHVPATLFTTEHWDHRGGDELEWQLPITPGRYVVNLYFAEIWTGAMKKGGRVFDVSVENETLHKLDVFAEAGGNNALVKSFTVDADEVLTIELQRQVQNPAIKGIEVMRVNDSTTRATQDNEVISKPHFEEAVVQEPVVEKPAVRIAKPVIEEKPVVSAKPQLALIPVFPVSEVQTDPDHCVAYGNSLAQAKKNYRASCSLPRKDCDPKGGGVWACSSSGI